MFKNKLILFIIISCLNFTNFIHSEDIQHATNFAQPLNVLSLSDIWENIDTYEQIIVFEIDGDSEVEFGITDLEDTGLTLDTLQNQLQNFADGIAPTIPFIDAQVEDEEDKIDYAFIKLNPLFERININGIEWLKALCTYVGTIESSTYENDVLVNQSKKYTPINSVTYFTIIDNHLYIADFSVPSKKYAIYEQLFQTTMLNLYRN